MVKKKILLISIITILLVIIFHYFALENSWYWRVRWIDIPAHLVGGFGVALFSLWLALKFNHINNICNYKPRAFLAVLVSVLAVAAVWEIFELIFKFTHFGYANYLIGAMLDIVFSLIGGVFAYLYFIKYKNTQCCIDHNDKNKHYCEHLKIK